MSTFVPNYECDLFISHAEADIPSETRGDGDSAWFATFREVLNTLLAQKLGSREWGTLRTTADASVEQAADATGVQTAPANAAMLLVVLTEAYLHSEKCRRELELFLGAPASTAQATDRLVVVLRGDVPRERWPDGLRHLLAYDLSGEADRGSESDLDAAEPRRPDRRYSTRLDDLSTELAIRLRRLKATAESSPQPDQATVFLGDATDDLAELRDSVKRYLVQSGLRVLPETWYPRTRAAFEEAARGDLAASTLFVQLMGSSPFPRTDTFPDGCGGLQMDLAKAANMSILRWHSPDLDLTTVADADHRSTLQRENVIAVGIEEFKRKVVQRAAALAARSMPATGEAFVQVNADHVDLPLAEDVAAILKRNGLRCGIAHNGDQPLENFANDPSCLGGVIIVYGQCPAIWVRQQLWRYRKSMARSEAMPPICAVYEGPPESKDPLRYTLPKLDVIDCRASLDEKALRSFIQAVHGRCSP